MKLLQKIKLPIFICFFFVALLVIWKVLGLPSDTELVMLGREYFAKYGIITVLVAAIIEGFLFSGWYAPGGLVIFLGVILAPTPPRAVFSVIATIIGFSIAYTLNFLAGTYGWYRAFLKLGFRTSLAKAHEQFELHGPRAIFLSYWEPNLASLVSTAAGIAKAPFRVFFIPSLFATLFWAVFWGTLAYFFGESILTYLGGIFFVAMGGWIIWIILKHYREKRATKRPQ